MTGKLNYKYYILAAILCLIPSALVAQVVMPEIFRDHMMLQRQIPIHVWGNAKPYTVVTVKLVSTQQSTSADKEGRWSVQLPAHEAGGPFTLIVDSDGKTATIKDVLIGDVWLASGQSNMSMVMRPLPPYTMGVTDYAREIASANEKEVRFFVVPEEADFPAQTEMHGVWLQSQGAQVSNVSAVAYYFARKVNRETGVPIAVIVSAVGSTAIASWVDRDVNLKSHADSVDKVDKLLQENATAVKQYQLNRPDFDHQAEESIATNYGPRLVTPEHKTPFPNFIFKPSGLYNAMIAPFHPYPIKGVLWYQGDADAKTYPGYSDRMKELIESWRASWNEPQMPFYFVMLQNVTTEERFGKDPDPKNQNDAYLREEQRNALSKIAHSGMAVATDVGDPMFPHPRNKKAVGERLALIALANDYGQKVVSSGPTFKSITRSGNHVFVKFDTMGSPLQSKNGTVPGGFEVAGSDNVFHPAMATIDGDTVDLQSEEVKDPKNVRYGWDNNPDLYLYNAAGLPAPPFTTVPQQ
jgi:sialate O-acetylesterase